MKNTITIFLKGLIIGIGKIIPGVSGAVIAISLGVYEQGLQSISNLSKKNIKFLINIGLGIIFSIVLFSNIIIYFLNTHYLPTMLLFIGLIIGGSTEFVKKVNFKSKKNILAIITSLILIAIFGMINNNNFVIFEKNVFSYLMLVISGIIDAFATVVPGISGTALLMMFGYYETIVSALGDIFTIQNINNNIFVISAYSIGMIVGVIVFSKMISYLFLKQKELTYSSIFGFTIGTIFILFLKTFTVTASVNVIIFSLILLVVGYLLSKKLCN